MAEAKQEAKQIVWSHSRLNKIIENPKEYYLSYKQGISPKEEKPSLFIGSAVHDGLERNSDDLTEWFEEHATFFEKGTVTTEQVMAESMVGAFLARKQDFLKEIALDEETGEMAEFSQEEHELTLTCVIDSKKFDKPHQFLGIIDLLFLTNKGWILCDYKTSSKSPDWDVYKSQLFDYILLLKYNFPEVPIYRVAIINLQKTGIKLRAKESEIEYKARIKNEYEKNTDLINWHIYGIEEFSPEEVKDYAANLTEMIDLAQTIENEQLFYLNHSATTNMYGKSQFWDIFYHTPDCHFLYKIRDTIFDEEKNATVNVRDCVPIDMLTVEKGEKVLNKYYQFKKEADSIFTDKDNADKARLFSSLEEKYITDEHLLEEYWINYEKNI